jgi:hypothetical protein
LPSVRHSSIAWERLFAEAGRWDKGDPGKVKGSTIGGKSAIDHIISLGGLVKNAPFIVVLFHQPWRRI